jgi:hypothetical protein
MSDETAVMTEGERAALRRKAGRHFEPAAKAIGDAVGFLGSADPNAHERAATRGERAVELIGMEGRMLRAADGGGSDADTWGDG